MLQKIVYKSFTIYRKSSFFSKKNLLFPAVHVIFVHSFVIQQQYKKYEFKTFFCVSQGMENAPEI